MQIRPSGSCALGVPILLLAGCQVHQNVSISSPNTLQVAGWEQAQAGQPQSQPGEAQSTTIRYARADGTTAARILISNDRYPFVVSGFVPSGTVGYEDMGSTTVQSSTFQPPPECALSSGVVPATCNWTYLSDDHDLVSTNDGTVYYMAGVGYDGPSAAGSIPAWFQPPQTSPYTTSRGTFGPNARGSVAVWKSTDHGQTFQWSSYFDPTAYFDGSCAYPQFRRPINPNDGGILGPPWDMGGSDGQAAWSDPITGKIVLTFQCVGYIPPSRKYPWRLNYTQLKDSNGNAVLNSDGTKVFVPAANTVQVNETILASFDGNKWSAIEMPKNVTGWRMGAIPYGRFFLLGTLDNLTIVDPANATSYISAPSVPFPQVAGVWPGFAAPPFINVALLNPNVLTRWGHNGYAFAYATNNAAPGAPVIEGYSIYYFTLPTDPGSSPRPNPQWGDLPIQLNSVNGNFGLITDPTAIDVGSGTTLFYWYDVNLTTHMATVRGRLLLDDDLYSQDFDISPPFSMVNSNNPGYFFGDYKTAGGYCSNDGKNLKSVYFPMWIDPSAGTANYAEVSTSVPTSSIGTNQIGPGCSLPAATNDPGSGGNLDRAVPRKIPLTMTKVAHLTAGRFLDPAKVKHPMHLPDISEHKQR